MPPVMHARESTRIESRHNRSHETVRRMPIRAANDTVTKNQPIPWPSPKSAPSFRLVLHQSILLMTVHPGLVPGMPRFLNAISFVMRSADVVKTTTLVKSAHVIGVARKGAMELSEGDVPGAGTLVTAAIDLQEFERVGRKHASSYRGKLPSCFLQFFSTANTC